jgi:hypothetical protein
LPDDLDEAAVEHMLFHHRIRILEYLSQKPYSPNTVERVPQSNEAARTEETDMPKISSDKLLPGMVLAKPIIGKNGMTLLGEGTELTERWIGNIQEMNVEGIFVEGPSEQPVPLDEALACLEQRFETVRDKPYMALIKSVVRKQIESLYS